MSRWTKPSEEMPGDCECGDRIVIIVAERTNQFARLSPRLVILTATETGWDTVDDQYSGYTVEDGILWSWERDITSIAHVVCPEIDFAGRDDPRRCPICGGTEHVPPLPGTIGDRCVRCCDVSDIRDPICRTDCGDGSTVYDDRPRPGA